MRFFKLQFATYLVHLIKQFSGSQSVVKNKNTEIEQKISECITGHKGKYCFVKLLFYLYIDEGVDWSDVNLLLWVLEKNCKTLNSAVLEVFSPLSHSGRLCEKVTHPGPLLSLPVGQQLSLCS